MFVVKCGRIWREGAFESGTTPELHDLELFSAQAEAV
jgi:hypothetical protein